MTDAPTPPLDTKSHSIHDHFPTLQYNHPLFIIVVLILGLLLGYFLSKQSTQVISVVGYANMTAQADTGTIFGGFETVNADKSKALAENEKKISQLKATIAAQGFSEKTIKVLDTTTDTDNTYDDSEEDLIPLSSNALLPTPTLTCLGDCPEGKRRIPTPVAKTYLVRTDFELVVTKNDLGKTEKLIEAIETNLVTSNLEITYGLTNKQIYDSQLKEKALFYGKEQATVLAKTTGLKVAKVITIQEKRDPYYDDTAEMNYFDSYTEEIPLSASYEITYELGPQWLPF